MGFKVFGYTKGLNHAFTQCCNTISEAARVEGPSSLIGKSDADLPWKDRLSEYTADERKVLIGSTIEITTPSAFLTKPAFIENGSLIVIIGNEKIHLTKRKTIVLKWILRGKMTSEIGLLESRSKRTIEGHIANIKRKFQAQTKGDIINMAHQLGLLHITFQSK